MDSNSTNRDCLIKVNKLNANDDHYKIVSIAFSSSHYVKKGEVLFELETSKTIVEVEAPCSGFLVTAGHSLGASVSPNELLAVISSDEKFDISQYKDLLKEDVLEKNSQAADNYNLKFSKRAWEKIQELNLPMSAFKDQEIVSLETVNRIIESREYLPENEFEKIFLVGGQGTARMLIDCIHENSNYEIAGIIDNDMPVGTKVDGIEVLGDDKWFLKKIENSSAKVVLAFTSLQDLHVRKKTYLKYKSAGCHFPVIIHRNARVERSSQIGEGVIVLSGAIVGSHARLGAINFVNTGAIVSHEVVCGLNNHFAPGSVISGKVTIGNSNLFGINSSVYMGLEIGSGKIFKNNEAVFVNHA